MSGDDGRAVRRMRAELRRHEALRTWDVVIASAGRLTVTVGGRSIAHGSHDQMTWHLSGVVAGVTVEGDRERAA